MGLLYPFVQQLTGFLVGCLVPDNQDVVSCKKLGVRSGRKDGAALAADGNDGGSGVVPKMHRSDGLSDQRAAFFDSKLEGSQRIEVVEAVVGIQQDVDVFLQAAVELLLLEHQSVDVVFDGVQRLPLVGLG